MAFDMYLGERHEQIHHQEEYLFTLAHTKTSQYPQLNQVWSQFYTDFELSAQQANALVHELLQLLEEQDAEPNKALSSTVLRLCQFFSAASRANQAVKCSGD